MKNQILNLKYNDSSNRSQALTINMRTWRERL